MLKSVTRSVWGRLIVGFIGVSVIAAVGTGYFIYDRFVATSSAFRDRTLQNDASVMRKLLRRAAEGKALQFPDFLADNFQQGRGKYAIVSDNGVLIAGSPGVTEPLAPIDEAKKRDFFLSDNDHDGRMLYGYTLQGTYGKRPVYIQVAVPEGELAFDSVLEEFIEDVGWIWVPYVVGLLAVNLMVARIGLKPLRLAASQAEAIGPNAVSMRLPDAGLPKEVHALVKAVNLALDRLETGYEAQKAFVADAAHELRTPVAVLKTHATLLPDSEDVVKLREEIAAMERLVNQLLDSARIESMNVEAGDVADLTKIAQSVAQHLGPIAITRGRSISVSGDEAALVNGSTDLLLCAVRNLVENALRFTPVGTTVEINVACPGTLTVRDYGCGISPSEQKEIFKRFWQGARDRGGGAGLGMDIVRRIVACHGGTIEVSNPAGGGACFEIRIPGAVVGRNGKQRFSGESGVGPGGVLAIPPALA